LELISHFLSYFWQVVSLTFWQITLFLGPVLLLAFLMNFLSVFVEKRMISLFGRTYYLGLFGWLGVSIHELGHAFFCLVFGHRINEIVLFDPDPQSGTLGYVNHSYNSENLYHNIGNFFIGLGPVFFGALTMYFIAHKLIGPDFLESSSSASFMQFGEFSWTLLWDQIQSAGVGFLGLAQHIFTSKNFLNWRFYLFIYLIFCIGSNITLSSLDIEGAIEGFASIVGVLLVANFLTLWLIGNATTSLLRDITSIFPEFYALMIFAIFMTAIVGILLLPIHGIKKIIGR